VLLFGVEPASVGYKEDARLTRLYEQIEERVSAVPGVTAASFSMFTFNQGSWSEDAWSREESPEAKRNRRDSVQQSWLAIFLDHGSAARGRAHIQFPRYGELAESVFDQ